MGSDGYYSLDGKKLAFKVETTQGNPLRDTTVALMAQMAKKAGIKLTENASADIFAGARRSRTRSRPVATRSRCSRGSRVRRSRRTTRSTSRSKAQGGAQGQNYVHGDDPQVDEALTKLAAAPNPTAEIQYANEADKYLWDDMYTLPLYQKPTLLAYSSNYKGIGDNSTQAGPLWNNDEFSVG